MRDKQLAECVTCRGRDEAKLLASNLWGKCAYFGGASPRSSGYGVRRLSAWLLFCEFG